ncbi:type I restriction-modification system, substrate-binding subunit [Candidatus Endomicrobiellum trichonymphae]|nr:type I restriction-modification system, substrate-binding subunit [Candidatus Endomicrobium trichonymphae]
MRINSKWEVKKLGEICTFINGLWAGKKCPFINVYVIRNTNFTKDGKLDLSNVVNLSLEKKQYEKKRLEYDDIILEKSGGGPKQPVGRVVLFDIKKGNFSFSNFTSVIRIINKRYVYPKYLYNYLFYCYISGMTEVMQSHSTGIRNLNFDEYKKINIVFPSISEQKKIVAKLDKFSENIKRLEDASRKNLQNAKDLFNSVLNETFKNKSAVANDNRQVYKKTHWEVKKLGEICTFINGLWAGKKCPFINVYVIRNTNFTKDGKLDLSNVVNLSLEKKQYEKKRLEYDDIILEKSGGGPKQPVGRVVLFDIKKGNFSFSNFTSVIRIINKRYVYPKYLYNYLFYCYISGMTEVMQSHSTGIRNLNFDEYKKINIVFPSISEQKKIVARLDKLSAETKKLEIVYQKKIDGLAELKKSVFKQTFDCG